MAGNQEKKLEYEKTLKECDISLVEIDQSLLPIQELEDDAKRKKHHVLIEKERMVNDVCFVCLGSSRQPFILP